MTDKPAKTDKAFSANEILPLIGTFLLMLILVFLASGSSMWILGKIIFVLALLLGLGTGFEGKSKLWQTGLGLFVLSLLPLTFITFPHFLGWAIGATSGGSVGAAMRRSHSTSLLDPKPLRRAIAAAAVGILALLAPYILVGTLSTLLPVQAGGINESGPYIAEEDKGPLVGVTPLHEAAGSGDIEAVKTLLAEGSDVNARDVKGRTPLYWAASGCIFGTLTENVQLWQCGVTHRHAEITKLLIENGATVNTIDADEYATPLLWAVEHGNAGTVRTLLENGANPNLHQDPAYADYAFFMESPMAEAEWREDAEIIAVLQEFGAQP